MKRAVLMVSLLAVTMLCLDAQETSRHFDQSVSEDDKVLFSAYDKLDFWLNQYSVFSRRAIVVEPGVSLADADQLNGKIPPPRPENHADEAIRNALLKFYGIEIILIQDGLAVCRWSSRQSDTALKEAAQSKLRSCGLSDDKIPGRVVAAGGVRFSVGK